MRVLRVLVVSLLLFFVGVGAVMALRSFVGISSLAPAPLPALPPAPTYTAVPTGRTAGASPPAMPQGSATQTPSAAPTATGVVRPLTPSAAPQGATPPPAALTPAAAPTGAAPMPAPSGAPVSQVGNPLSGPERIAWAQARGVFFDIWTMGGDGSQATRISTGDARNREPAWSPDGRWLAFVSDRDGNNEIYIMRETGGDVARLTTNPGNDYAPAWSPNGTTLAFVSNRDGNDELYIMGVDGSRQTRLSDNPAFDGQPAWSPDGARLAFTSNRGGNLDIYSMPAAGGEATRLTRDNRDDRDPAWSPDGALLAFASNRNGQFQIFTMKAAGGDERRLTNLAKGAEHPSWGGALAGQTDTTHYRLVYVAYTAAADAISAGEVYTMRQDGQDVVRLTDNALADQDADIVVQGAVTAMPAPKPPAASAVATAAATPAAKPTAQAATTPGATAGEIIIDELSSGFARGGTAKYWKDANIGYQDHMLYTYNSAAPGDNWGRWLLKLTRAGKYEAFAFVPAKNATTTKATYTIAHGGLQDKRIVNQLQYESAWVSLGVYEFKGQGEEYIQLSDVTDEPAASKRIGFDAVKLVFVGP